jgi:hypothetical protein
MTSLNGFGRRRGIGIAAGALVIVLAACGSQANTVTVKKQVAPSPQKVVLASVRATTAAKSARISLSISTEATGPDDFRLTADGVADFTTRDGAMTMQFAGPAAKLFGGGIEVRTVDGVGYVKMPESLDPEIGGKWLKTPGGLGGGVPEFGQSDPTQFLAYLETVSTDVTKVGSDTIRGVETTHYHASLDLGKAVDRAEVPASLRDDLRNLLQNKDAAAIPADLWVDSNGLARRIKLTIDFAGTSFSIADVPTSASGLSITVSMDLYDFGVPVHVVAPPASDTIDMKDFGQNGGGTYGTLGTLGAPS